MKDISKAAGSSLRLIQQREKFLFFPAGDINMMIVGQYNITTLTFNIFLYVPEVDEIGMVHAAKSRVRQRGFQNR